MAAALANLRRFNLVSASADVVQVHALVQRAVLSLLGAASGGTATPGWLRRGRARGRTAIALETGERHPVDLDLDPVRGLLDTSVFITAESGRQLDAHLAPEETAVSVVTQDNDFGPVDGAGGLQVIRV